MTPPDTPRLDAEALLEHEAWVRRLARAMVGDEHEANEVVQQTWLNALLWPPRQVDNLRAWLGTVARNVVRQRYRGSRREQERRQAGAVPEAAHGDLDSVERLELQGQVVEAVQALRTADRDALVLRYYEGLTPTQMAERTGQPLATVKSRLARARQRLRVELERRWGSDGWRGTVSLLAFGRVSVDLVQAAASTASTGGAPGGGALVWGALAAAGLTGAIWVLTDEAPTGEVDPLRAHGPATAAVNSMPLEPYDPPEPTRELVPPPAVVPPSPPPTEPLVVALREPDPPADDAQQPQTPVEDEPTDLAEASLTVQPGAALAPHDKPGLRLRVRLQGEPPAPTLVDMSADPVCYGLHPEGYARQHVRVGPDGGLHDVFIALTNGVPDVRYKAPEEAVVLEQLDCVYEPQVFGIVKRQDIEIYNRDPTLHNVHAAPKQNKEFNLAMPKQGMQVTRTFKKGEDAVRIQCDVHPWMRTYCFVMEHPYFATTDATGRATIDTTRLPDGFYGVRVWHRILGERTTVLEIVDGRASHELLIKG